MWPKVRNVNDWKRHMTIENLLTMTSGMNSQEIFYPETDEENRLVAKAASSCMVLRGEKSAGR